MGSGSTRPNTADDKMFAAIERGSQDDFKDRKPPKNTDVQLIKDKAQRTEKAQQKTESLRALRLAAEQEKKAAKEGVALPAPTLDGGSPEPPGSASAGGSPAGSTGAAATPSHPGSSTVPLLLPKHLRGAKRSLNRASMNSTPPAKLISSATAEAIDSLLTRVRAAGFFTVGR